MADTTEIDEFLSKHLVNDDGDILTGWVICYEIHHGERGRAAGFIFDKNDTTPWRAIGLLQWAIGALLAPVRRADEND